MADRDGSTIQLDPEKAQKVNSILGLISRTVQGELAWRRRPEGEPHLSDVGRLYVIAGNELLLDKGLDARSALVRFSAQEYEASDGLDKWLLTAIHSDTGHEPSVSLHRFGEGGKFLYSVTGIAALSGLAAAVESVMQKDLAA